MAKQKSNYREVLAKAKASKQVNELRGVVATANIEDLKIAILAATLEVLGVSADVIMAIDDKETAGAYLLRAAYLGGAQVTVGINTDDLIRIFNGPIEGEENEV